MIAHFDSSAKELPGINQAPASKNQQKINLLQRSAWEKQGEEDGGGSGGGASARIERSPRD